MKKPVMMETMNGILAVVVVPVVVVAGRRTVVVGAVVAGRRTVVVGAVVVAGRRTVVVGAVVVAGRRTVVVGLVVAGTTTVVVGLVVAGTTTVVVGLVVALVIIIVWSMRRKMRMTALVFVVVTIMMTAAIEGQAAVIAVVMIGAGGVALRTHRNEAAKMDCLCRY
jgi:hypothetical protein